MDLVTSIALSVDHPLIKAFGIIIHDAVGYAAIVLALLFIGELRPDKRKKVLLSFAITILLVTGIKHVMAHERPCVGEDWCPESYSFPSMHAAIAFTLMTAFMNKRSYPFYVFFALLVGFTRINLGVHIFQDVVAALPMAMLSYFITYQIWERVKNEERD